MSDTFKELDGGTLFTTQQYWRYVDDATGQKSMRTSVGTWAWSRVVSVQTLADEVLPELVGPRCTIELDTTWLHLNCDYQTVLTAWRRYRLRYGSQALTFTTSN